MLERKEIPTEGKSSGPSEESRGKGKGTASRRILLVEDEAVIALSESKKLAGAGYSVVHALSGEDAIELFRADPSAFDIILMDIDLGSGMDGTEAARLILKTYEIPILFLSSHMEPAIVEKTEEITNYGYVVKSSVFTVLDASIKMAFKLFDAHKNVFRKNMEMEAINERLRTTIEELQSSGEKLEAANRRLLESERKITAQAEKQRESEESVRRQHGFLRTLIDNLPDAIYFNDTEGRKIIANPADVENFSISESQDPIGKNDLELFPGEIGERGHRDNIEVIRTGRAIINREEKFIRRDGSPVWLLTSKIPLRDYKGEIIGLVGIGRDITAMKLSADKIEQERIFLKTLINVLPDPVYFKDLSGRKTISNVAYYHKKEPTDENNEIGKTDLELFPGPVGLRGYRDDLKVFEEGASILNREEDFVEEDGRTVWVSTSKVPLRNAKGEIIGLVGIAHDITMLKELEGNLRASAERTLLLMKELEHRVKNNLSMIASLLSLDLDSTSEGADRERFKTAIERIDSLASIYECLYLSDDPTLVDLRFYFTSLVDSIREALTAKDGGPTIVMNFDELRLSPEQAFPLGLILNEMLTNAFKYAYPAKSGGIIRIGMSKRDDRATLSVADEGPGFPEGFDLDTASSNGMTLMKMLAKQLKAELSIETKGGASISIAFPLRPSA
jgi:PAS domain S-box-containing protein